MVVVVASGDGVWIRLSIILYPASGEGGWNGRCGVGGNISV